ncbi:hypothetical protein N7523_003832 [Penicillium sp. IBT 18751x]|nr:hypothetical protein N7523_003832 [Penicillium sp. IBT 18751x]
MDIPIVLISDFLSRVDVTRQGLAVKKALNIQIIRATPFSGDAYFKKARKRLRQNRNSFQFGSRKSTFQHNVNHEFDHAQEMQDHWDETKSTLCNHLPSFGVSVNIWSKDQDYVKWSNNYEG